MLAQRVYDSLPDVMFEGRLVKDGSSLHDSPATVAFLRSNGYVRSSRKHGHAYRATSGGGDREGLIVNIPLATLMQLPHRCRT